MTARDGDRLLRVALAAAAVLVAVAVHVLAALDATGPVWAEDEIGPLATSRLLAGVGEPWHLSHLPYYPGWAVLLTPVWWFTQDPATVYRVAIGVSVAVAVAAVAPLAALVRRTGASWPAATAVAAVVVAHPARSVMSNFVLIENALTLAVAVAAWSVVRWAERPDRTRAVVLGLAVGAMVTTHVRAAPMAAATALLLVWAARRRWRGWLLGLVVLVATTTAGQVLHQVLTAAQYAEGREQHLSEIETEFTLLGAVRALVGQLWYTSAAWAGLAVVGVVLLVLRARRDPSERTRALSWWALGAVAGMLALTVAFLAGSLSVQEEVTRVDYWSYGRYLDPFVVPVVAVGLGSVLRRRVRVGWVPAVAVAAVAAVFAVTNLAGAQQDGYLGVINAAGLLAWGPVLGSISGPAVVVVSTVVSLGLLAALRARLPAAVVLGALGVLWPVASVVADVAVVDPQQQQFRHDRVTPLVEAADPDGGLVGYDLASTGRAEDNRAVYWLAPRTVLRFDSAWQDPPSDVVLARTRWPAAASLGAVRAGSVVAPDQGVWLLPGPLQDRALAAGLVEDLEPGRIEDPAYRVDVQVGALGCGVVASRCAAVTVHNLGSTAWSPAPTLDGPGGVRIVVWWPAGDGWLATLHDLPASVAPGASTSRIVTLTAPAGADTGRQTVEVGLEQDGFDAFPGPEAVLAPVEVTVR